MSKKQISELKEYFKAGKRPTEGHFEDLLDSYVHFSKNLNSDFTDLNFTFPNNESNKAIDVLFGNNFVNGFITIEIVGSFAHQSSVGMIKKQFQIGANPDNGVWYGTTSRIVEAEGSILDNIYIGNFEWDPVISQYKITIYHTTSSGNPYNIKISQQSVGELAIGKVALSGFYTRTVNGQNKHFINFNQNVGIGTINPKSRLQVLSSASTPDQYGTFSLGDESMPNLRMGYNNQYTWIQSHLSPLQINPIGNSTILNRDKGNVGIGTQNPDHKLTVKGKIHAEDIIINANVPADYVFEKYYDNYSATREDYSMMNLDELESFIRENKHLPEIPSGSDMAQEGVNVGDFQMKLLQKIEELTLYVITQNKELEQLKSQINKTNA